MPRSTNARHGPSSKREGRWNAAAGSLEREVAQTAKAGRRPTNHRRAGAIQRRRRASPSARAPSGGEQRAADAHADVCACLGRPGHRRRRRRAPADDAAGRIDALALALGGEHARADGAVKLCPSPARRVVLDQGEYLEGVKSRRIEHGRLDLRHGPAEDPARASCASNARVRLGDLVARQLDPIVLVASSYCATAAGVFADRRDLDARCLRRIYNAVDARRAIERTQGAQSGIRKIVSVEPYTPSTK